MDVTPILDSLNDAQRSAVTEPEGSALILAGAGSGKTRVLVRRIAWLCCVKSISPYNILAVTFTNKAAGEMRERIEALLEVSMVGMWVGTFHAICHRILRTHYKEASLPATFQILDANDQYRLIKKIIKTLDIDEDQWSSKTAQWYINAKKEEGLAPEDIKINKNETERQLLRIYVNYEEACKKSGLVDFAGLLIQTLMLLKENAHILSKYHDRFEYILVDEFQDTNALQYKWLRLLSNNNVPVFAVGDDDQSIYRWRGARIENIHNFSKDFENVKTFKLEQNYRSTGNILTAANNLITNNKERLSKNLWTDDDEGEPIYLFSAFNEQEEARFISEKIHEWISHGNRRDEIAILYRSNAQSRIFEEIFISTQIPYRVYGGLRFFERAEIKDALAYMRLCYNYKDDSSFERIINLPTRGIGDKTLSLVRSCAQKGKISLWEATILLVEDDQLTSRSRQALNSFLQLIGSLSADIKSFKLSEQIDHVINKSGLKSYYGKEKGELALSRIENLEELVNAAKTFSIDEQNYGDMSETDAFLAHAVLESGEGQGKQWEDCVQLMTLHSAKGLEFPIVFLTGMEEGLFPTEHSLSEPNGIEEERRLCYVGITRAKQRLFLSHAETRRRYGSDMYNSPSRFINEVPTELISEVRPQAHVKHKLYRSTEISHTGDDNDLQVGQRVDHEKFGCGVVIECEGQGSSARVHVNFETTGSKWLVVSFANLKVL